MIIIKKRPDRTWFERGSNWKKIVQGNQLLFLKVLPIGSSKKAKRKYSIGEIRRNGPFNLGQNQYLIYSRKKSFNLSNFGINGSGMAKLVDFDPNFFENCSIQPQITPFLPIILTKTPPIPL